MSKPTILLQLDTDSQPSVFDSVAAIDAGAQHLLRHGDIAPENARDCVHGAIFTRGPADLKNTAIFIGGSDVARAEAVLQAVEKSFLGPFRCSVMLDPNGANTTAAAAVLAAAKHVPLAGATALVLAATGPVGARVVRLLAREGAAVRAASRSVARAAAVCNDVRAAVPEAKLTPLAVANPAEAAAALAGADLVIAAGAAGVQLLAAGGRRACASLKAAIDANAVPPLGIEGVEVVDKAVERDGVFCYGALGIGGTKMKIHKRAIQRLFETNDLVLDAEELFRLGQTL